MVLKLLTTKDIEVKRKVKIPKKRNLFALDLYDAKYKMKVVRLKNKPVFRKRKHKGDKHGKES